MVANDGVEDGNEFACDGDEGELLSLAGRDKAIVEGLESGVEASTGNGAHVEHGADVRTAAGDDALPLPLTGLASERSKAGETGGFLGIEGAEFGHDSDEGVRDARSDTGNTLKESISGTPERRAMDGVINFLVEDFEFGLEGLEETVNALGETRRGEKTRALTFSDDHLDNLTAASDESGEEASVLVRESAKRRVDSLGESSNDRRIDAVRLGALSEGVSERADLSGVEDNHGEASSGEGGCHEGLEATGRLKSDDGRGERKKALDEGVEASIVSGEAEGL